MVPCQRCGKGEAEWRCQTCGRVVDTACARPTQEGVFCADHLPGTGGKAAAKKGGWSEGSKSLQQLFMTLLFLTLGLALIIFVGDIMIGRVLGSLTGNVMNVDSLKSIAWIIVYGMGGLTAVIGVAWLFTKKRLK